MVKLTLTDVSAFTAHCISKKINGFRLKGSCFMVSYFCSNSNCQNAITCPRLEIGSLPEQVIKQKANLFYYNTQSKVSPCLKQQNWIHSLHTITMCGLLQLTSPNMRKEFGHVFDDACCSIAWRIRWLIEPRWTVLDCCNVSGVLHMSVSATPKCVLIGKHPQHEADLLSQGRLWKGESTKQTCHVKTRRWVTADFVDVSRRVSVNCKSTFCSDVYLDYSVDSASLNNSEELNIRNFQLRTCVRRPQSLKCLY